MASKGLKLSGIFAIRGFRLEGVVIDAMHCVDLGCAMHIIGNILHEMVKMRSLGRNMGIAMQTLWEMLRVYYTTLSRTTSRLQSLSLEDIRRRGKSPKLSAKTAQTRHLAGFALELAQKYNSGNDHDNFRQECAQALVDFHNFLETRPRSLNAEDLAELADIGRRICSTYAALNRTATGNEWKLTPKFPLLLHLVELQAPLWGNPKFFWCYSDEDMVGAICFQHQLCSCLRTWQIGF